MTTNFESKTLKDISKKIFNFWGGLSIFVTLVSGTIYIIFPSMITKIIIAIIIFLAVAYFFKVAIDTIDKEFKELESIANTQREILNTLDEVKNSTSVIAEINKNISNVGLVLPQICSSIETVENDINSELIDFIFTKDKNGDSGNLVLIMKCDKSIDHTYELTILSTDISSIKLDIGMPVGKNYNVIEIRDANNRSSEAPYIAIKFRIKKGINIAIIRIDIIREIKQMFGIQFSLNNITLNKTIIEKTTLNLENMN